MDWWKSGIQETFEYYEVDSSSWRDKRKLEFVSACDITRDESELMGSATIEVDDEIDGEVYIRAYLLSTLDGVTERTCLGTFLAQTPKAHYDGKSITRSLACYSPLLELRDDSPPIGYTVPKSQNIVLFARQLFEAHCRAPVCTASYGHTLDDGDLTASDADTWLSFVKILLEKAGLNLRVNPDGSVSFVPQRTIASLQPAWTYTDDNSSIFEPDVDVDYDWFCLPNRVELVVSSDSAAMVGIAENNSESKLSVASRGRKILHRDTSPKVSDGITQDELDAQAMRVLKEKSGEERTLNYRHAYCPVMIGDGVRLNYTAHGLDARAKVTKQVIHCTTGCTVDETALYTPHQWK